MKRKRGHKKGKSKGVSALSAKEAVSSVAVVNVENDSGLDEFDNNTNSNKYDSGMEIDTPSSTGTDQPHNLANINPDGSIGKGVGKPVGRVKVKLRTPKMVESQLTTSDAPTQSDTDKSSQQMGLEKQGVITDRMEDSANSLPEAKMSAPGNLSKKAGSIKIKSSKALGSSVNQTNEPVPPTRDGSPRQKEQKMPHQDPRYDKQELETCLMVIKKVMKMDAAEPFNVPVNPVALGIPDYFDVIDTPMDFGTICSNLESGVKYSNSEDVFKDVQYIWDNCFKYNSKGDYILDLMRRVKKNFTKYWTAAGLYSGQPLGAVDGEEIQEKVALSGQGKLHSKGGQYKKARKGRRHKADCLCAICVLKRRRREREENERIAKGLIGASDNNLPQELKQEESSPAESPSGDNSSSDMDESSADPNALAEVEERTEVKMEESKQHSNSLAEKEEEDEDDEEEDGDEEDGENDVEMKNADHVETSEQFDKSNEDANKQSQQAIAEESGDRIQSDTQKEDTTMQQKEGTAAVQQEKHKGMEETHQKVKANQIKLFENPMLLDLCGILFPDNSKSIWSGPHSLVHRQSTSRTCSIRAAIDTLMK